MREALKEALERREVAPTAPLFAEGWGDPTLADRVDELLAESDFVSGRRQPTGISGSDS